MKEYSQKVVPIRSEVTHEIERGAQRVTKNTTCSKVDVVKVGKLKFTIYTNSPSEEAMDNFNELFQSLFEHTVAIEENDALPA